MASSFLLTPIEVKQGQRLMSTTGVQHTVEQRSSRKEPPVVDDGAIWELDTERHDGHVRLGLTGELDLDTAPALLAAVVEQLDTGATDVVVDLTHLSFIDSSGLGTLVGCWRRATNAGATLVVANPNEDVRVTLEITGLDQILPITPERVG
jgi:anti-anti-sigma factor